MISAHRDCTTAIKAAATKCYIVKGALSDIYSQAKDILEGINPDRPAPHPTSDLTPRGRTRRKRKVDQRYAAFIHLRAEKIRQNLSKDSASVWLIRPDNNEYSTNY